MHIIPVIFLQMPLFSKYPSFRRPKYTKNIIQFLYFLFFLSAEKMSRRFILIISILSLIALLFGIDFHSSTLKITPYPSFQNNAYLTISDSKICDLPPSDENRHRYVYGSVTDGKTVYVITALAIKQGMDLLVRLFAFPTACCNSKTCVRAQKTLNKNQQKKISSPAGEIST